jgi:hypothetical protein
MAQSTTTAPRVNRKPQPKPARKCRVEDCLGLKVLVITETLGPKVTVTRYHLWRVEGAELGAAFNLRKFVADGGDGNAYAVNLGNGTHPASCECNGWLRWGHRTVCRHLASLRALKAAGAL